MALTDFRHLDPATAIEADICIVGSGPAGWTLAEELSDSGLRIVVLESGGAAESGGCSGRTFEMDVLNATEDVGVPLFNGRCRTLGGTPEIVPWGNRCIALDDIDYEARPWVPMSGWPIGSAAFAPFLDRASQHLGAGPYLPDGPPDTIGKFKPNVDPDQLHNVCWAFGRQDSGDTVRYAQRFRQGPRDHVRVIVNATVTHLNTNDVGDRIESVEVAHPDGHHTIVTARAVVLCAGGIENARILLYSNRQTPNGVGNAHDLVGRYLMDHPRDHNKTVTFDPKAAGVLHRLFGPYMFDAGAGRREYVGGLALSPKVQRRERLLNCAAWPALDYFEDDPIAGLQRLKRGDRSKAATDLRGVASHPGLVAQAVHSWARRQPMRTTYKGIGLFLGSEQTPDADSRVTLSDKRDALGLPIARTDWRISELDRRSQAALAMRIKTEFARLKLPEARVAEWVRDGAHDQAVLVDGCHPTGTTRMASDPRAGVVDADCQVHGVEGLFVAGSSVFPTAGHANPTLMIVALTCRLADNLKLRFAKQAVPAGYRASPLLDKAAFEGQLAAARDVTSDATRLESSRL